MKKAIIFILVVILSGAIFLQNAKKSHLSAENEPSKVKLNRQEVVFWTLQMADFAPYMNNVIANFEKGNPEIKIKWIDVPFSEGEKRTLAAILSDNPPDLVNLNPDFSAILAQKGALQEFSNQDVGQFSSEIIDSLKYNNKLYALPWYATSAVTIYNKELLKKAGFSRPPRTYDKLGKISSVIKSRTGAYSFMPTITENDTMLKILNKYGVNSASGIVSDKSIEVFNFYKDLYQKGLIPKETITQTQREALEKYMSGQIVFFQSGANFLNMIKENAPSIYNDTDVARQIVGDLGQNDFSLMNLVIPVKSDNKESALKFALFLTNEENQLELAKQTNVLATNRRALRNRFYTEYDNSDLMAKARVVSANQLNHINPVLKQSRGQKEINIIINIAVQEILLDKKDAKKALQAVSDSWKKLED